MTDFRLDQQFKKDTIELGMLNDQILLLMNNALVPWFIIVPVTQQTEIFRLDETEQNTLYRNINSLSRHILEHYEVSKINIGAIGNIVRQLHIHIIGRSKTDYAWPNVVWGNARNIPYSEEQLQSVINNLMSDHEVELIRSDV